MIRELKTSARVKRYRIEIFLTFFFIFLGAFLVFSMAKIVGSLHSKVLAVGSTKTKGAQTVNASASAKIIVASPAASALASPLATASAAPVVYSGFCLNVPVLLYHHVEPTALAAAEGHASLTVDNANFDKQMAYLAAAGYRSITADELTGAILGHSHIGKSVVVTLDDGYSDAFTYAYPIAQKYHIILNLMIPTGLMGNPGYLSWDQLKQMVSGGATVYNHTWSHASLPAVSADKLKFEVTTAKDQLQSNLGKSSNVFTYPYGANNTAVINYLRVQGYTAAFSTNPGTTQCDSFIMSLHRTRVGNSSLSAYGL